MQENESRLVLGIKRQVFKRDDPHMKKAESIFDTLLPKVLARDEYTCMFCSLQSRSLAQAHHLDHDHYNIDINNLACICPWCHAYQHVGEPVKKGSRLSDGCLDQKHTRLILLPGVSAQDFNHLQRAIGFALLDKDKEVVKAARKVYSQFANAEKFKEIEKYFGSSKTQDLASGLSNLTLDEYKRAQRVGGALDNVRIVFAPSILMNWAKSLIEESEVLTNQEQWSAHLGDDLSKIFESLGLTVSDPAIAVDVDDEVIIPE